MERNDVKILTSREILDSILKLKSFIKENLPNCKLFRCTPTLLTDHGKASLTVTYLAKKNPAAKTYVVDNHNINGRHLEANGINQNLQGSSRLAVKGLGDTKKFIISRLFRDQQ